jgi:site-specific DNA-methyltransferase (adenine-specific)/site-specific DNA-methyltransferase (cytosine-N4-specific)
VPKKKSPTTPKQFRDRIVGLRRVRAGDLVPNESNWRQHPQSQQDALRGCLTEIGYADAVLARELPDGSLVLIDGHLRRDLDPDQILPALVLDVDEAEAKKLMLTLDPLAAMATANVEALSALLREVDTGNQSVADLISALAQQHGIATVGEAGNVDAEPQIDRAEELLAVWKCERGQVWEVPGKAGTHRVMCGDCREAAEMDRLVGGRSLNVVFTSPPYASQRDYDKSSGFKPIPPAEYVAWWDTVQANVRTHLAGDGSFFVNIKPCADGLDTNLYVFDLVCMMVRKWGWHFATEFCWERTGVPKGVTRRFKNQFEPVYQFVLGKWKIRPKAVAHPSNDVPMSLGKGSGNTGWAERQGAGGVIPANRRPHKAGPTMSNKQGERQDVPPHLESRDTIGDGMAYPGNRLPPFTSSHEALGHAAAFPIGLPDFFFRAFSDEGDIVCDPFCGSGSSVIAAENTGRVCYGMELSPKYVAVLLQRCKDIRLEPRLASQ